MTDLDHAILALIRTSDDRVIRARDCEELPEAKASAELRGASIMRHVDQTLQRMRRRGDITYSTRLGWQTVLQALRRDV